MRKLFVVLCLLISSQLFAITNSYETFSSRSLSMGHTGVASAQQSDVFISNPALFSFSEYFIKVPSFYMSVYNVKELAKPGGFLETLYDNPLRNFDQASEVAISLLESIKSGEGKLLSTGLSFATATGSIGLAFDNSLDINTLGSGYTASSLVLEENSSLSLALSIPFFYNDHKISFGFGMKFNYRMITSTENGNTGYSIDKVLEILRSDNKFEPLLNTIPVLSGFSIPINLGMTLEYSNNLRLGLSLMNLLDTQHMNEFPGLNQLYYSLTGSQLEGEDLPSFSQGHYVSFSNPASLNFGLYYQADNKGFSKILRPGIAFDYVDILGLLQSKINTEEILKRTRLGVELSIINFVDIRAGLSGGYFSFGLGVDFMLFRLDAIYAIEEYGETLGDKPVDQLAIKFTLGYDI